MNHRPEFLPKSAVRVVKASRELEDIDKLVWSPIFFLDQGPEGCYLMPDFLARRIGRSGETVE